ncbi:MAG: hypothetical protein K2Q15_05060 [Burkholderiales bacterium]|nr:hypothetical protein [Burkholderiales bacterium]
MLALLLVFHYQVANLPLGLLHGGVGAAAAAYLLNKLADLLEQGRGGLLLTHNQVP